MKCPVRVTMDFLSVVRGMRVRVRVSVRVRDRVRGSARVRVGVRGSARVRLRVRGRE